MGKDSVLQKFHSISSSGMKKMTKFHARVAPEINLLNPLHAGKEACEGIHPAFKLQG